jgi:hypothetical protein
MRFILISLLLFCLLACNKDKFATKPTLKIKSAPDIVPVNGILHIVMECTDKEGDTADSIFVRKIRLNRRPGGITLRDSFALTVPKFPNTPSVEFVLDLDYNQYVISASAPPNVAGSNPPRKESDTLTFKFVAQDKAKHKSDTVTLTPVVVLRN